MFLLPHTKLLALQGYYLFMYVFIYSSIYLLIYLKILLFIAELCTLGKIEAGPGSPS